MKTLLLSLLLIVVVGLFGFKIYSDYRHGQQVAILAVFNQANAATTQTRVYPNGRKIIVHSGEKLFSRADFVKALDRISTIQCPQEFSMAWLNFVQTLQRGEEPFAGLGALGEYGVSVVQPSGAGTKDALARLDRLNASEAYRRVVMVALKYGVQIHDR
jgi:hypothetical protein